MAYACHFVALGPACVLSIECVLYGVFSIGMCSVFSIVHACHFVALGPA